MKTKRIPLVIPKASTGTGKTFQHVMIGEKGRGRTYHISKQTPFLSKDQEVILVGDLILQHSLTDIRSKNGPMKVCYGEFTMGRDDWAIDFVAYGFYIEFHDGGVYSLTQEGKGYSIPAKDCKIVKK